MWSYKISFIIGEIPAEFEAGSDGRLYHFSNEKLTYTEAKSHCENKGAELAYGTNADELRAIRKALSKQKEVFLGRYLYVNTNEFIKETEKFQFMFSHS